MLLRFVDFAFSVYTLGLIAYVIMGWFKGRQIETLCNGLRRFYEPLLARLRSVIKPIGVGTTAVDVTPVVLLFGLMMLKSLVIWSLPAGL